MTCTNSILDRSDKSCPVLTEIDLVVICLKGINATLFPRHIGTEIRLMGHFDVTLGLKL